MNLFLNLGLAWIAVILTVILAVVFMTRKLITKSNSPWISINRALRKHHKGIGMALILVGLIHGMNSSFDVLSFNWGTAAWILSILLGLNWYFRKQPLGNKPWIAHHRTLTLIFILALGLHLSEVGGVTLPQILFNLTESSAQTVTTLDPTELGEGLIYGSFADGTYTGSATGYGSNLTVEIVIENNVLTSITILSHNEKQAQFYAKAFNTIPSEILDAQSLDVDTVSGSTFSSVGIINAVNNALEKALLSGSLPSDLSLPTKRRH